MASLPHQHEYTFDEYLLLEDKTDHKTEFDDGQIVAMSGGTEVHARLCFRMASLLDRSLKGCRIYGSDLKVRIEATNKGYYPDAMAICGDPSFYKHRKDVIVNPFAIVEVVSPSDRLMKIDSYLTIPSLENLILVSQRGSVQHYQRNRDDWNFMRYAKLTDGFGLSSGQEITLSEIFADIDTA